MNLSLDKRTRGDKRNDSMKAATLFLPMVFIFFPDVTMAVHKCIDKDGAVSYSQYPCPPDAKSSSASASDANLKDANTPEAAVLRWYDAALRNDLNELRRWSTREIAEFYADIDTLGSRELQMRFMGGAVSKPITVIAKDISKDETCAVLGMKGIVETASGTREFHEVVTMWKDHGIWKVRWKQSGKKDDLRLKSSLCPL